MCTHPGVISPGHWPPHFISRVVQPPAALAGDSADASPFLPGASVLSKAGRGSPTVPPDRATPRPFLYCHASPPPPSSPTTPPPPTPPPPPTSPPPARTPPAPAPHQTPGPPPPPPFPFLLPRSSLPTCRLFWPPSFAQHRAPFFFLYLSSACRVCGALLAFSFFSATALSLVLLTTGGRVFPFTFARAVSPQRR